jgi:hypothetical protein
MRFRLIIGVIFLITINSVVLYADIIMAASGSQPDLQFAVDSARVGDTVQIPAGNFQFSGSVRFNAGITLTGTGVSQTTLSKTGNTIEALIIIDGSNGLPVTVTGITFIGIDNQITNIQDNGLRINNCKDFCVCNCTFRRFGFSGINVHGDTRGVVDHCIFIENFRLPINSLGYGIAIYGDGDASWNRPLELGTEKAVFVEDCYFERCRHGVASNDGSNYVFRFNTITDNYNPWTGIDAHGFSSSPRGSRSYEIYGNTVNGGVDPDGTPHDTWAVGIRGGDGVIFNNTITSTSQSSLIMLVIDRVEEQHFNYPQPDQTTDLWLWNNTQANAPLTSLRLGWNLAMQEQLAKYLQEGRDFHFAQKPGYAPYTYPHPLNQGTINIGNERNNGSTKKIDFKITANGKIFVRELNGLTEIDIYDIRGRQIANIPVMSGEMVFDCKNGNRSKMGNGYYVIRFKSEKEVVIQSFVLSP